MPLPAYALDPARGQHGSGEILREVLARRETDASRVLAVTEADLFIPMLTFVFGQAQLGGIAAVVSLARLRQEIYGLPPDEAILLERAAKEALHELGHTFGLVHCSDPTCVASLSTSVRQIDTKNPGFCAGCSALLAEPLRRLRARDHGLAREEDRP